MYNGNISNTTLANGPIYIRDGSLADNAVAYTYHYDQLNRLKKLRQYTAISRATKWDRSYITLDYQENISYEGNCNILTYGRNGDAANTAQTIDSLTYNYNYTSGKLTNNKLNYVHDAISSSGYNLDIRNQTSTTNYQYDATGNLLSDAYAGITNTGWTVYNKPDTIYKAAGNITYAYNTANQRIIKTYGGVTTRYIRDVQGNVMGIYDNTHGNINWREQHLYGSSRLGMWLPNINLSTGDEIAKWDSAGYIQYELTNHLGNVMESISDSRQPFSEREFPTVHYFGAFVISGQDYYPFGMPMPNRQWTAAFGRVTDSSYRYGFNGKENDNTVKGLGNQQDYGERIYDDRVGRFLSVDPLIKSYPWWTPYEFAALDPVRSVDVDGLQVPDADPDMELYDPIREELKNLETPEKETPPEEEPTLPKRPLKPPRPPWRERLLSVPGRIGRAVNGYLDDLPENVQNAFPEEGDRFREALERLNQNKANGQALENVLTNSLIERLTDENVASQVTLLVSGKVNNVEVSVRIRIDNLTKENGKYNLYEAKFSIEKLTENNVVRALTENQKQAFSIITYGTSVSIFVRGPKADPLGLPNGKEIDLTNATFSIITNSGQSGQTQTVKSVPLKPSQ